jgi:hypothetical protein
LLLKDGLIWGIGDGSHVNIQGDKWIPSTHSYMIQFPIQGLHPTAKVSELINYEFNWWNVPLIEHLFPADLVDHICNIAINPRIMQDKLIWVGNTNGQFSVRSAYHLEVECRSVSLGSSSVLVSNTPLWSFLWQLHIPRNVILFLWRACNDILPTKDNLCRRRIVDIRSMCGKEAETPIHAIWNCAVA